MSTTQPPISSDNITPAVQHLNAEENSASAAQAVAALHLLSEAAVARPEILENNFKTRNDEAFDEEGNKDCPILPTFLANGGPKVMLTSTKFTLLEFLKIWDKFAKNSRILGDWRRTEDKYKPKDILLMALASLKQGGSWDWLGRMFHVKGPTFESLITQFMDKIADEVYKICEKTWRMFSDSTTTRTRAVFQQLSEGAVCGRFCLAACL